MNQTVRGSTTARARPGNSAPAEVPGLVRAARVVVTRYLLP
jgi:hypothetical protein